VLSAGDIADDSDGLATGFIDPSGTFVQRLLAPRGEDELGALSSGRFGRGQPNAAGCARDDDHLFVDRFQRNTYETAPGVRRWCETPGSMIASRSTSGPAAGRRWPPVALLPPAG